MNINVSPEQPKTATICPGALTIKGEFFRCDWPTDEFGSHGGWAHANKEAQAVWQ